MRSPHCLFHPGVLCAPHKTIVGLFVKRPPSVGFSLAQEEGLSALVKGAFATCMELFLQLLVSV